MRAHFVDRGGAAAIRVIPVTEKDLPRLLEQKLGKQAGAGKPWLALNEFRGKPGSIAWLPDARGPLGEPGCRDEREPADHGSGHPSRRGPHVLEDSAGASPRVTGLSNPSP